MTMSDFQNLSTSLWRTILSALSILNTASCSATTATVEDSSPIKRIMAWGTADYSSTGGGEKLNEWSTNEGRFGRLRILVEQKTFMIAHSMNGYANMYRSSFYEKKLELHGACLALCPGNSQLFNTGKQH